MISRRVGEERERERSVLSAREVSYSHISVKGISIFSAFQLSLFLDSGCQCNFIKLMGCFDFSIVWRD